MNVLEKLQSCPHLTWGNYPTPLEEMPRLRASLGQNSPRLFIKRDDYTGPGFGGNKVRKLEYFLAQAVAEQCDVVITIGGIKSNHCRVTAAFCARLGLRCILVLNAPALPPHKPASLWADEMYGAEIHLVSDREERKVTMQRLAERLRAEGQKVCEIPLGASTPLGALGYIAAMQELKEQISRAHLSFDYLFHSSSSGGTQAGISAGCQLLALGEMRVIGVSPDDPAESIAAEVSAIIRGLGELLCVPPLNTEATVLDAYIGAGYGIGSPESEAAIQLLARTEGIILDPTYSAKAMAALLHWIQLGKLTASDTVLFWHTGGQLAHFQVG